MGVPYMGVGWLAMMDVLFSRLGSGTSMHFWRDVAVNETSVAFECAGFRETGGMGDLVPVFRGLIKRWRTF